MTAAARGWLCVVALAALAVPLTSALIELEPFGDFAGQYGLLLADVVPPERHVTALVSAVVFDYRALDTLGEELILFAAAVGCTVLLRGRRADLAAERGEKARAARPEPEVAARAFGAALVGPMVVLGLYVVSHGHLSPGGGFQGGLLLVAAVVLAYAAGQAFAPARLRSERVLEVGESVGAGGFVVIALAGLLAGGAALENVLGLGVTGMLLSGGTIPLGNLIVGLEVAGATALVLSEFLDQALLGRR
jgi:multicomponent Na+:H+ antiporter subunit B